MGNDQTVAVDRPRQATEIDALTMQIAGDGVDDHPQLLREGALPEMTIDLGAEEQPGR